MISTAFINLAFYLITKFLSWFPAGAPLPSVFHTAGSSFGAYLSGINDLLPLDALFYCVVFVFTFEILIFGFMVLRWVVSFLPFIGGRG